MVASLNASLQQLAEVEIALEIESNVNMSVHMDQSPWAQDGRTSDDCVCTSNGRDDIFHHALRETPSHARDLVFLRSRRSLFKKPLYMIRIVAIDLEVYVETW